MEDRKVLLLCVIHGTVASGLSVFQRWKKGRIVRKGDWIGRIEMHSSL